MGRPTLQGILPACVTPFDGDGRVDERAIVHNLQRWNRSRLSGYLFLGSTGEFPHLDEDERDRVIATAREWVPADRLLVVGTGALSTRATIGFTRRAAELGADYALVITPFYYRTQMQGQTLMSHFTAVADASPIPVLIYNIPAFTGIMVPTETVLELAEHPNIVGIKDSSSDVGQLTALAAGAPEGFAVFNGSARVLVAALAVGCVGGMLAAANVAFDLACEIMELVEAGRLPEARLLQARLTALDKAVRKYGIGGWKAAAEMIGLRAGPPRPPLLPPDEAGREAIGRALTEIVEAAGAMDLEKVTPELLAPD